LEGNKYFYDVISKNLGDKIIIPLLGNHETHPIDFFDFENLDEFAKKLVSNFEKFVSKEKVSDLLEKGFFSI